MTISPIDVRDAFFDELYRIAKNDPNVIFMTADMGAFSLERFKKDLPRQYYNVGVAEQNMVSVAAGLALGGKKVFIYSIVPFVTLRCYEQIKIDLCCMNLPVTIVGIGAGVMYGGDGPTHHALHDIAVMRALPEMTILNPADATATKASVHLAYESQGPVYVRLEKGKMPVLYEEGKHDFSEGLAEIRKGIDVLIISSGLMTHTATQVTDSLEQQSISVGVLDLYRIKPVNENLFLDRIKQAKAIVTLEENSIVGGIGSIVAEILADEGLNIPLKRIAMPDEHCYAACKREDIHGLYKLDATSVSQTIKDWLVTV